MTDILKETFTTRATETEPPPLDLDAIVTTGTRRLRRRRAAKILGTTLMAAAVIATGLTVLRPHAVEPAAPLHAFTDRKTTYAVSGTIHYGSTTIETGGRAIQSLLLTDVGVLFTKAGSRSLQLADGRSVRTVATIAPGSTVLAAGETAGWVEPTPNGYRTIVKNLRTGDEVVRIDHIEEPDRDRLVALDGGYAYVQEQGSLLRIDLSTGSRRTIRQAGFTKQALTIRGDQMVSIGSGDLPTSKPVIWLTDLGGSGSQVQELSGSQFDVAAEVSPEGRYLVISDGNQALQVYNRSTEHRDVTGSQPRIFGHWLSETTFVATAASRPTDLVTCTVRTAGDIACEVSQRDVAPGGDQLVFPSN
ncbi:hypothetical protein E1263_18270 [Kribbella antibiotica]|uniref:WD40 repeat domain-containing protein n=1 Tax=Kribbella antibiotica TaxID=190195 RepID=A0A4R4ZJI7_9ACTN|nr:hypothetical protein [Kribbella antibiotica]TDD58655.1 hypothetical protein E1263_18270 [Kribbella antibiotica]